MRLRFISFGYLFIIYGFSVASCSYENESYVEFQINDFSLNEKIGDYFTIYEGRGYVQTQDKRLENGNYFLLLKSLIHPTGEYFADTVIIKNRIGVFDTYEEFPNKGRDGEQFQYRDWSVSGFSPLQEATLVSDASDVVETNELNKVFELKDFRLSKEFADKARGYGILISLPEEQDRGDYLLWVEARQGHSATVSWSDMIRIENGRGILNYSAEYDPKDSSTLRVEDIKWDILGYKSCIKSPVIYGEENKKDHEHYLFEISDVTHEIRDKYDDFEDYNIYELSAKDPEMQNGSFVIILYLKIKYYDEYDEHYFHLLMEDGKTKFPIPYLLGSGQEIAFDDLEVFCSFKLNEAKIINSSGSPNGL